MPLPKFLSGIFGGGAGELIEKVGGVVDNLTMSKEEKEKLKIELIQATNSHVEKMANLAQNELDSYLKDTQSARETNARIQESDKASWLAKNVGYCIDVFIVGVWGFLTIYLLVVMLNIVKKQEGVDYTAVTAVWGGVTAFAGTILNFHRGTSRSDEKKSAAIDKMIANK